MYRNSIYLILLSMILPTYSPVEAGDELVVIKPIVNLRAGPSLKYSVILQLSEGDRLAEIERQGDWVEVETADENVKSGWVYQPLVAKVRDNTEEDDKQFARFKERFDIQNEVLEKQNGVAYFLDLLHKGEGNVDIIATQAWLDEDRIVRERIVSELFLLWAAIAKVGQSISIHVLDEAGEQHMVMLR